MDAATVRVFCHVEPPGWTQDPTPLMDASFAYLTALNALCAVRAVPMAGFNLSREHPRWEPLEKAFIRPMGSMASSIVIGTPEEAAARYTPLTQNVAILLGDDIEGAVFGASLWHTLVLCPTAEGAHRIRSLGPPCHHAPPSASALNGHIAAYGVSRARQ